LLDGEDTIILHQLALLYDTATSMRRSAQVFALDDTGRALMQTAMNQLQLSARVYHRVLKLARTIADLAGSEAIQPTHLAEALQYQPRMMVG